MRRPTLVFSQPRVGVSWITPRRTSQVRNVRTSRHAAKYGVSGEACETAPGSLDADLQRNLSHSLVWPLTAVAGVSLARVSHLSLSFIAHMDDTCYRQSGNSVDLMMIVDDVEHNEHVEDDDDDGGEDRR